MTAPGAELLEPEGWINRASDADRVLLTPAEIEVLNRHSYLASRSLVDLAALPAVLPAAELASRIRSISHRPDSDLFYEDGSRLGDNEFAHYEASLNLHAVRDSNPVHFGLAVRRTDMRTYPTSDPVYKSGPYSDLDRFQENGLFPADAVAILHASADGEWLLVQSYNYLAWTRRDAIATGERDVILDYRARPDFIVVAAARVFSRIDRRHESVSGLQFDMAVKLPLIAPGTIHDGGSGTTASYLVEMPTASSSGQLAFQPAMIECNADVSRGFLPYTREHLIRQAFRFLGEPYGWGHSRNARDCTGFVADVYKSFGILLPRNSDDQAESDIGHNLRFDASETAASKVAAVAGADVGSLVYMPGHVVLYLGNVDDDPYVIHDVARLHPQAEPGERGFQGGVAVAPLLSLRVSETTSYVDAIQSIKTIR